MTRQDKLNSIGQCQPSVFELTGTKNQMSYFIIPLPHDVYTSKEPETVLQNFKELGWEIMNHANPYQGFNSDQKRIYPHDEASINSIKSYIYEHMLPNISDTKNDPKKAARYFFSNYSNLMLQKNDFEQLWMFEEVDSKNNSIYKAQIDLDGIDLWIFNKHIAFFTLRTKLNINDNSTVSNISSKYNRTMRDFRKIYVNEEKYLFTNDSTAGVSLITWLLNLITNKGQSNNLLKLTSNLLNENQNHIIYHNSYYAKMITALHINENEFNGIEIESTYAGELNSINITGTSVLEEMPYHLASTGEIYPNKMWENNEEYINEEVNKGGINIWKYWSGIAMHDAMAFFSVGEGGTGIINHARHSYYFIYMLNLYVNYTLRLFEHKLIDREFTNIENIYPIFIDTQRLRNQFMSSEIATKFQPNIVHNAISSAMKTDKIFLEIKENIDGTMELTRQNTDMMITAVMSLFTFCGIWISQDKLLEVFKLYPWWSAAGTITVFSLLILIIIKRSSAARLIKQIRRKLIQIVESYF
jgi:hypothetical protein